MKRGQTVALVLMSLLLLASGIFLGVRLEQDVLYGGGGFDAAAGRRLIDEAWSITRRVYVDRAATEPTRLAYGAIDGMIDSLGDTGHSTFMTPEEVARQRDFVSGQYQGVGITVEYGPGHARVLGVLEGSPAQAAGLQRGDLIVAIDGQPIVGAADGRRVLGPEGTSVTLTVVTDGQTRDVVIVRARLDIQSVSWATLADTSLAHLRISSFARGTADELDAALAAIKLPGVKGIILDLRGNSGGLENEVVGVVSEFVGSGSVMLRRNADGEITTVPVKSNVASAATIPLVVLIDSGTASAAEVGAAAIQEAGRAKLVGETTAGTGTILNQFMLSDGSALLLGVEEWLTPSGRSIWRQGLAPDVEVTLPEGVYPLRLDAERDMTREQLDNSGDRELLAAMALLGA